MLAEYRGSPYALSLLWDVVFYNPLVPVRTRKYANKMLFEMISIPDFKQRFTVVFISLYRVMVLHRERLLLLQRKRKRVDTRVRVIATAMAIMTAMRKKTNTYKNM